MSNDSDHQSGDLLPVGVCEKADCECDEVGAASDKDKQPASVTVTQEPSKQLLCGYLMKQSLKGPIKVWRKRWLVFDEHRCCLFYCNQKGDPAQGMIDISTATFNYDVENLSKHQFEILYDGKTVSLQAPSKDVMNYWLAALQKKRRKFSAKRKKAIIANTHELSTAGRSRGGLIGNEQSPVEEELEEEEEEFPLLVPVNLDIDHKGDLEGEDKVLLSTRVSSTRKKWMNRLSSYMPGGGEVGGGLSPVPLMRNNTNSDTRSLNAALPIRTEESPEPTAPLTPDTGNTSPGQNVQDSPTSSRSTRLNISSRLRYSLSTRSKPVRSGTCPNCLKAQETISYFEKELSIREREVKDRDEINDFLRQEIRLGDLRARVEEELATPNSGTDSKKATVEVILQREQTIEQLQNLLEDVIHKRDAAYSQLEDCEWEIKELREQVYLFKESIIAKDQVVVDLTNQLFQLEHKGQLPMDPHAAMLPSTRQSLEIELKASVEALEAYKQQNNFLSSEIVELNAMRNDENEAFRANKFKLRDMEAKLCKVESKYIILLQETQEPRAGNDVGPNSEMVSRMLKEVLDGDEEMVTTMDNRKSYDNYGFNHVCVGIANEVVTKPLVARAMKLDHQARNVENALDEMLASQKARWQNYMAEKIVMLRSEELKLLIRDGIPSEMRTQVWNWVIRNTLGKIYEKGLYQKLLEAHKGQTSVAVSQIELDLLRTLPTNRYYVEPDSQGINSLRRVLVSFSWYDSNVGYCQGLNRLAAIALLFLDEEDSFWCLVAIVHRLLPEDYYSQTLLGSQTDQRVLKNLLDDRWHKLSNHLNFCEIDFSLITFNWFHTIYVDNLPVETMLRIWDTFLYEGSKVLFRFALAIFKYNEDKILSLSTPIGIFNHLRSMCQNCTDVDRLVQIGFYEVKNFSKKWIDGKRASHRFQLKSEQMALDALRNSFPRKTDHSHDKTTHSQPAKETAQETELISFDSKEDLIDLAPSETSDSAAEDQL